MSDLTETIEARLSAVDPAVEVVMVEPLGRDRVRLYVDHPDGVDLALCERVTRHLEDLLASYSLEVSSPGTDRPLTKPEHFERFAGRQVRVRTREKLAGQRTFTGVLAGSDERAVSLQLDGETLAIPHESIQRSNLVPDFGGDQ